MMNGGYCVDFFHKYFDTSALISEIRQLSKEIDNCYLPSIQSNYLVDDVQKYRTGKLLNRFDNFEDNEATNPWNVNSTQNCFEQMISWKENAVKMSESDSLIYNEVLNNKMQRKKKLKRKKESEDQRSFDPSNTDEVEEEIKRQRDKFYEDKGYMVKEKQSVKKYRKIWKTMIKKELGKCARQRAAVRKEKILVFKKAAKECSRLCRQRAVASQKCAKDALNRGRRLTREISMCWRQLEKEEKTSKKKADKLLSDQKRKNLEVLEARKQQRKLNYLITQTELYTHFMSRKMSTERYTEMDDKAWSILDRIEEEYDDKNETNLDKQKALESVKEAVDLQLTQVQNFAPIKEAVSDVPVGDVPTLFHGELKSYQKKGVDWLLYLFEQGINGILADEMGLGKTIQTIAFLATLAEKYDLWGPFLIVAPASTVHNWTQEFNRFLPAFRVVPYWGNVGERKILRRFWNNGHAGLRPGAEDEEGGGGNVLGGGSGAGAGGGGILQSDSSFHVVVSSYQVVLQDAKMVGRVRWQYLVLDEAHAIKNTSSQRWNTLLSFECRNRLLLTGTPIQNTMQELWALLHFIMPTLFDSHEEFNDWFSRDIESQATAAVQASGTKQGTNLTTTKLNATQLSRLHLILQPFMLRRVKAEVEHELPDKIEISLQCHLSSRQSTLYQRLKRRIRIDDLSIDSRQQKSLLNLVMQLRKVCNHPDLVEPRMECFSLAIRFVSPYFLWPKLLASLAPLHRTRPLITRLFDMHHPSHTLHSIDRDPHSPFSFLAVFDIAAHHYHQFVVTGHTAPLLASRHKHIVASLVDLFLDRPCPRPIFPITNVTSHVLNTMTRDSGIDLVLPHNCHGVLPWTITDPRSGTRRCLAAMATVGCHHSPLLSRCIVVPTVAHPVQLAVSTFPTRSITTTSSRFSAPITVSLVNSVTRIADSTKLAVLDQLLTRLKQDHHRVLIYSQMTRMIDIIEDLMRLRDHCFIRLDGSSRLSDRRDMVSDFQSDDGIFAFLLSTRAGGLGINLTAADTVIFFDSDWNPTVDQQAMDRAHRLGQARQVTVYRLVCRDTVEEKILYRAEEKREMHRMVIAGADLCPDQMRPRDVASLLLEDDEMNIRLEQRRRQSAANRGGGGALDRTGPSGGNSGGNSGGGGGQCGQDAGMEAAEAQREDQEERLVTFSGSALHKKRRMAWAGVMKSGGRPKKLKLLEPTINTVNAVTQTKKASQTSAINNVDHGCDKSKK